MALSQNHLVAAGMRRGKEAVSGGHVALSCCLQTSTIELFPDRRSVNGLVSVKNKAPRDKRKDLQRLQDSFSKETLRYSLKLPIMWAKSLDLVRIQSALDLSV